MSTGDNHFLDRLQQATNDHDLDALVGCFAPAYQNEAPAHPSRSFDGTGQVRANWQQIFAFVPDVRSRVLGFAVEGDEVWSEWEMSGTRVDGSPHLMRGVIVFRLRDDLAVSARFYLEPVDDEATTVDEAVRAQVHSGDPR